ncbi:MAG TPA: hypothetical protein IGS53_24950 [Leptolyngbyaceae cyanobacterium M33_DOE_097]|nr:hypothetical protein [Leptolyngbyaceae cyanobacterium M33_DOE_097]
MLTFTQFVRAIHHANCFRQPKRAIAVVISASPHLFLRSAIEVSNFLPALSG